MRISCSGPSAEEYNAALAVGCWSQKKEEEGQY